MSQWARNNPEQSRLEARRADLHMEAVRMMEMEAAFQESEQEPEPLIVAMNEQLAELYVECRNALREV